MQVATTMESAHANAQSLKAQAPVVAQVEQTAYSDTTRQEMATPRTCNRWDIGRGSAGSEKRYVTVAEREVTSAVFVAALGTLEGGREKS